MFFKYINYSQKLTLIVLYITNLAVIIRFKHLSYNMSFFVSLHDQHSNTITDPNTRFIKKHACT